MVEYRQVNDSIVPNRIEENLTRKEDMNLELLTCCRITAGLLYPPIPVQPADLSQLYADMTQKYPYQTLQHLPDGVRMANPEGECLVQIGRLQVNENVMYFQASKEKCVDIFRMVADRFNIQQFLNFGVKLTAFLPIDMPGGAPAFMEQGGFRLSQGDWRLLGPGLQGAGMRVVLHQDGIVDLRIEPYFNNPSELYVELDMQHVEPFGSLENVDVWMQNAYDYMFGSVKDFLSAMSKRR